MRRATMEATARQLQKAATREKVVESALELFAKQGIVETKTADIAKAIGMSHGVIFLHFPKRDDLVIAVIDEFGRRLAGELRRAMEGGPEQHAELKGVLQAHLRVLEDFEPFYARVVTEAPLLPPVIRSTLLALQMAVANRMRIVMTREHAAGQVRVKPGPLLFHTWIGLVHHYLVNRDLFTNGGSVIAAKKAELIDHFMSLVQA